MDNVLKSQQPINKNCTNVNSIKLSKKSNIKTKRHRRKVHKTKQPKPLSIFSCNAANIKNKILSFEKVTNDLDLGLFCLQETHLSKAGCLKFSGSQNFQIYEKVRTKQGGGGLAIGILKNLNPTWIRDGGETVEAMTVKFKIQNYEIRVVNGYGPQDYDDESKKKYFWEYLDAEVLNCKNEGSGLLIFMDGNSWLGSSVIKNDPHFQNKNGEIFNRFLSRNPNLYLLNSSHLCEGSITRSRYANGKKEESIIDFALVCDKIMPYVSKMIIDEEKIYSLSNYSRNDRIIYSDHNSLIVKINLRAEK